MSDTAIILLALAVVFAGDWLIRQIAYSRNRRCVTTDGVHKFRWNDGWSCYVCEQCGRKVFPYGD